MSSGVGLGRVETADVFRSDLRAADILAMRSGGRVWARIGAEQAAIGVWDARARSNCRCDGPHARIAAISGRMPMMFMTRVRL